MTNHQQSHPPPQQQPPHLGIQGLCLECSELLSGAIYALIVEKNIVLFNHLTPRFFSPCFGIHPTLYVAVNPNDSLAVEHAEWPSAEHFQVLALTHEKASNPSHIIELLPALECKLNIASNTRGDKNHSDAHRIIFFELGVNDALTHEEWQQYLSKELDYFSRWIQDKQYTLVLIVKNTSSNHSVQGEFLAHNERLSGIASVHTSGQKQLLWQTLFWHSGLAVTSDVEFILAQDQVNGQWIAVPNLRIKGTVTPKAPSKSHTLVVLAEVITDANQPPDSWVIVSTIDEAIQQGKTSTPQAVVLAYQNPETFKSLLERVLHLRKNLKPATKILIRELGTQLRHQEQRIAVQLGTYGILPKELNFSRCLQMIETMTAGELKHPSQKEISIAFQEIAQNTQQGYLRQTPFVKKINHALKRGLQYNVEHALIKFRIIPGMLPEHCIIACKTQRNGDYFTASTHFVYLFLEGCRPNDIGKSLASLFYLPVEDLFCNESRYCHPTDILNELKRILQEQSGPTWPDLSSVTSQFERPSGPPLSPLSSAAKTPNKKAADDFPSLSPLPMKNPTHEKITADTPDLPFTDTDLAMANSIIETEMNDLNDIKQGIADTKDTAEDNQADSNTSKSRKPPQWPSPPSS